MRAPEKPDKSQVNKPERSDDAPAFKFDEEQKAAFLRALEEFGMPTKAARAAGIAHSTAYDHRKRDEAFSEAWGEALDHYRDRLEIEAYRRAVDGWDEPVFYQGEDVGSVRKYSDALLTVLLKGHRPERYRERVDQNVNLSSATGVLMVPTPAKTVADWVEGDEKK